jgi:hypothetical protein
MVELKSLHQSRSLGHRRRLRRRRLRVLWRRFRRLGGAEQPHHRRRIGVVGHHRHIGIRQPSGAVRGRGLINLGAARFAQLAADAHGHAGGR